MANGTTGTTSTGTTTAGADPIVGQQTATESSLSNWAGPYVTEMLGRGQAISTQPYQAYTGPLTAGASGLQSQAFQGIGNLAIPTEQMQAYTPQTFTAEQARNYMNPYLQAALDPQIAEARRQAEIDRMNAAGRLTRAGAYGGSRQAVMESEGLRNLASNLANITGTGYMSAYDRAMQQFNTEEERRRGATGEARDYGLNVLRSQADMGGLQRQIEQQGIEADIKQFEEEREFPYKSVQYMQSLLQGLPVGTSSYSYAQPSQLSELLGTVGGIQDLYDQIFGRPTTTTPTNTTPATTTPATTDTTGTTTG
jgi:hypothetical protein